MKIAIIEDDNDFAFLVQYLLDDEITRFKEVDDFVDSGFDLVITDLRLKHTYGLETVIELKPKTNAPIVVLTGLAGPYLTASDMKLFTDAGATEVFSKDVVNDPTFPIMLKNIINNKKIL